MKRNQGLTLDRQNRCKNFMETTTVSVDTDFAGYPADQISASSNSRLPDIRPDISYLIQL